MRRHIIEIDGLRAFAVLFVLAQHWLPNVSGIALGGIGVRLFFVISGFLITDILLGSRAYIEQERSNLGAELRSFYIRRTLRIFPVYYAILLVMALAGVSALVDTLPWHLLYASNVYFALRGSFHTYFSHLWSLSVEEQFYAVWPFLILLLPKRAILPAIVGAILAAPAFRLALVLHGANPIAVRVLTPACMDSLGAGALLAYGLRAAWRIRPLVAPLIGVGIALIAGFALVWGGQADAPVPLVFGSLGISIAGVGVVAGAALWTGSRRIAFLRAKPLAYVGAVSYGVYLFHPFVHAVLARLFPAIEQVGSLPRAALLTAATIAVAGLSFRFFETPINRLKRLFPYGAGRSVSPEPQMHGAPDLLPKIVSATSQSTP